MDDFPIPAPGPVRGQKWPQRMFVNQPSKYQNWHEYHGRRVLAVHEYDDTYRVYFLEGKDDIHADVPVCTFFGVAWSWLTSSRVPFRCRCGRSPL